MTTWAEAKLAARQKVHGTFFVPCVFYDSVISTPSVEDDVIGVRIHDKFEHVGDLAGTNLSYAETAERATRAIFRTSELAARNVARGSMITMLNYAGDIVGYHIESVHPPDGYTTSCDVTPLSASELTGTLLPDGTAVP